MRAASADVAFNGGQDRRRSGAHGRARAEASCAQSNGFMPAAPYRMEDNPATLLDRSDIVWWTPWPPAIPEPRPPNSPEISGGEGDVQEFGEFIRLYMSRYDRWTSPLFLLGESYGTTRAAGIAGYLADHGISFNGVTLLSMAVDFQTLEWNKSNDLPYALLLPTFNMIAGYHHKLQADLSQDMTKTRQDVARWAMSDYLLALSKGDAMMPEERRKIVEELARYTGLRPEVVENNNLRIDVPTFTHELLLDQKLVVGRLDGRFSSPDPEDRGL